MLYREEGSRVYAVRNRGSSGRDCAAAFLSGEKKNTTCDRNPFARAGSPRNRVIVTIRKLPVLAQCTFSGFLCLSTSLCLADVHSVIGKSAFSRAHTKAIRTGRRKQSTLCWTLVSCHKKWQTLNVTDQKTPPSRTQRCLYTFMRNLHWLGGFEHDF